MTVIINSGGRVSFALISGLGLDCPAAKVPPEAAGFESRCCVTAQGFWEKKQLYNVLLQLNSKEFVIQ